VSVVSFSERAMARLSASAASRPNEASAAELIALKEYSAYLTPEGRRILANITRRLVEIERTQGAKAVEWHLDHIVALMRSAETTSA
jgi:hypothetical protein